MTILFLLAYSKHSSASIRTNLRPKKGVTVVMCSDTHGLHRDVTVPDGDVFIHAGDFTHFGKITDAEDFNEWLGTLPHKHKIVVNGNHEHNAEWKKKAAQLLSNAHFLRGEGLTIQVGAQYIKCWGEEFFWPMKSNNPYYDMIPEDVDILICHGPVKGYVDDNTGCATMLETVQRVNPRYSHYVVVLILGNGECLSLRGLR